MFTLPDNLPDEIEFKSSDRKIIEYWQDQLKNRTGDWWVREITVTYESSRDVFGNRASPRLQGHVKLTRPTPV